MIKIPFKGYPKPTASWSRDGVKVETSADISMEVGERHATLTIKNVTKDNAGPYRLVVENEMGSDSCVVKVAVNGELLPSSLSHPVIFIHL